MTVIFFCDPLLYDAPHPGHRLLASPPLLSGRGLWYHGWEEEGRRADRGHPSGGWVLVGGGVVGGGEVDGAPQVGGGPALMTLRLMPRYRLAASGGPRGCLPVPPPIPSHSTRLCPWLR